MKGWIGIVLTAVVAVAATWHATPWIRMTVPIAALLLAFKIHILRLSNVRLRPGRLLLFLLWPGMDPEPFAKTEPDPTAVRVVGWGLLNLVLGVTILLFTENTWLALLGIGFTLHIGLCCIHAGSLRLAGIPVGRLFINPPASKSLAEFWGRRWNLAFHVMIRDTVYRPLGGRRVALFAAFLVSGLLHELAISYPAGRGFGLPTLYFAIHGLLMLSGLRGRTWTLAAVILPLPLLFHTGFHESVVAPLLEWIH